MFIVEHNWKERELVLHEGNGLGGSNGRYSLDECKKWCDRTDGCNSISYRRTYKQCYLKDKCVTPNDDSKAVYDYKTYYKPCVTGILLYIKIIINYYLNRLFIS